MTTIIKSDADYKVVLEIIEHLIEIDPDEGTSAADHLDLLTLLVQDYESRNFPMELPPLDALRFRIEQYGWSDAKFARAIGMQRSHFSEVMTGKKRLPINAIRKAVELGIPAKVLLQPFPCETT